MLNYLENRWLPLEVTIINQTIKQVQPTINDESHYE